MGASGIWAVVVAAMVATACQSRGTADSLEGRSDGHSAATRAAPGATPRVAVALDTRRQQLAGVRTDRVRLGPVSSHTRVTGVVAYDATRLTEISARVGGWVRQLAVRGTGGTVSAGEALLMLTSTDLLDAENDFLVALRERANLAQQPAAAGTPTATPGSGVPSSPATSISQAREHVEQDVETTRGRLLLWDLPVADVRELERRGRALGEMTVRAPRAGTVIDAPLVDGMYVEAGQRLFRLADLSVVWVEAAIPERDVPAIRTGRTAVVMVDSYPGERIAGRIASLSASLSEETRTLAARIALDNPAQRLKPGMFAMVEIAGATETALTVPIDAVIDTGREQVVFLAEGDGRFDPRAVRTGRRFGDRVEILEGLQADQPIAISAAFLLDSESQLRAALTQYAPAPPPNAPSAEAPRRGSSTPSAADIVVRLEPDPPRSGQVGVDATVTLGGMPVDDADVHAAMSMPAMPSMGMGAMRSAARLSPVGRGRYRGTLDLAHGGRWDLQVTASRAGATIGSRDLAFVTR